jgi:hypothetical protein
MTISRATRRVSVLGLAGSILLVGLAAGRGLVPKHRPQSKPDAFQQIDLDFRAFYSSGRAATLERLSPVIVVEMDQLILIRNGTQTAVDAIPPLYHRLKSVTHIPLALYVGLAPFGDAPLNDDRLARLREFRGRIDVVASALDDAGFSPEQRSRSRTMIERSTAFLDGVLAKHSYDLAELTMLTRSMAPLVLAHVADAARSQIDTYHAQVSTWRRQIPAAEWGQLRVVVMGPQLPRKHNTAVQYFAKVLGLPGESRRLVYAEELSGRAQALTLLSTHQIDSMLSTAFFEDPERMEIDLLGNAASVYLDTLDLDR